MRITATLVREQWLQALNRTQAAVTHAQQQVSTGQKFSSPSEDPVGAARVNQLQQTLAQNTQFIRNGAAAQNQLSLEEDVLTQVGDRLQRLRELAVSANTATQSIESRGAIAVEAKQILSSLVALANTPDGNGKFLFAGFAAATQPFSQSAAGVVYNGDQGQRLLEIAPGQRVADGDSGYAVFGQVRSGNGTFNVTAGAGNTGTGLVGRTAVADASLYPAVPYALNFTSATTYEVRDSANTLVASGAYVSGQTIAFQGVQIDVSGAVSAGDSFAVSPSGNQSVFETVQNFIDALGNGGSSPAANALLNNQLGNSLRDFDQSIGHILNVRADIGARLGAIESQRNLTDDRTLQLKTILSSVLDVDYAEAVTRLSQEATSLEAAHKAFAQTQSLSLFKYL
jgi:flagellar hook-associated protein 3 FlgL